ADPVVTACLPPSLVARLFSTFHAVSSHLSFFFPNDPAPPDTYPLSLHDALPIWWRSTRSIAFSETWRSKKAGRFRSARHVSEKRSEEHTSELQSLTNIVCRLLLEKKKNGCW